MGTNITPPKEKDFNQIFKLLKQLWPNQSLDKLKMKKIYLSGLISNNRKYLIATSITGEIIGFVSLHIKDNLWQAGNLGHIDELIVHKTYRGQGVGRKLIDEITEIAKANYCKRIELDSAFHRKKAHQFYKNLGYENRAYLFSKII